MSGSVVSQPFLRGGGKMGEFVRAKDWTLSPLGNPETWDQSLKTTVSTCLNALTPICIFWGEELVIIYNDAYSQITGGINPDWLGTGAREVRSEAFVLQSSLDSVIRSGKATSVESRQFFASSNGPEAEVSSLFICSPIFVDSEKVEGIFCTLTQSRKVALKKNDEVSKSHKAHALEGRIAEQGFYNIFNEVPFAVAVLRGKDLIIDFINQYNLDIWQCEKADVIGQPLFEARPEIRTAAEPLHNQVFETGKRLVIEEIPIELGSGDNLTQKWFTAIIDPLRDEANEIIGQLATSIEVSPQVLARKKIQESEEKLQDLFMQAPAAIAILEGVEQKYVLANQRYQRLFNRRENELIGRSTKEVFTEVQGRYMHELLANVYETGEQYVASEFSPVFINSHNIEQYHGYYNFVAQPIKNKEGKTHAILIHAFEVTQQIAARKKVEESERRLQLITDAVPLLISYVDKDCRYRFNNKAYEQWFGHAATNIHGKTMREVLGENAFNKLHSRIDEVLAGKAVHFETLAPYKDGGERYIMADYIPHFGNENEVLGFYVVVNDISERRKSEFALKESEERFRSFADSIQNLAWMADSEGWIYWYNQRWYDYTGTTFDEMQGWGWGKVHHPDHVESVVNYVKKAWYRPVPFELTFPLRGKNGDYRWFLTRCVPVKNKDGEIVRWIGTNTDIHEQKIGEERIRESEERFRTLAEALPQMVWMRNMEGQFEFASKNWEEYSGVKDIREAWKIMTHPEDAEPVMSGWRKASERGESFGYEVRLMNKVGEYRWHYAVGKPIKNESGQVLKYIGAVTDVHIQKEFSEKLEKEVQERTTELKAKNADLENTQSFLQQLIDSSIEFIVVLDNNLNFLTVNKRSEEMLGFSRWELQGKYLFDINPREENTEQHASILRALKGETIHLDKRPTVASADRYVDTYYIPLRGPNEIKGVIIMAREVTDIVNSEKKLKQINQELHRSNEDLQQFAHVASHDLKEPVRKIKTYLNRLDGEFGDLLPVKGKEFINKINSASTRISSMIDGVLLYASVDALDGEVQSVSLKNIIDEILDDSELVMEQKKATVFYKELPELLGIPLLLYQLFYNLINNALKFSKVGIPSMIKIRAKAVTKYQVEQIGLPPGRLYTEVLIEDNGIGFQQASAEEIFITFRRLNSKDKFEGTGLGLSLCKKIVERHGGIISAKSETGNGATFSMILPSKLLFTQDDSM